MPKPRSRWSFVNVLPLIFVLSVVGSILYAYVHLHVIRAVSQHDLDEASHKRVVVEASVAGYLSFMLLLNYALAIFTDPGQVPSDYIWTPQECEASPLPACQQPQLVETKRSGERRNCKWCGKYKPDRTHHCRICQRCVLKMDHHCPWIANCVGWRNHKYFFLLVIYALLDCYFVGITMWPTVQSALNEWEMPFQSRAALIFGETLAIVSCGPVTIFLAFHGYLMLSGLTTIEFCEKSVRGVDSKSIYDYGVIGNIMAVLGPHPLLWLLPVCFARGDGLAFRSNRVPLLTGSVARVLEKEEPPSTNVPDAQHEPEWTGEPTD